MSKYIDFAYKLIGLCEKRDFENLRIITNEAEDYFLATKEYEKLIKIHLEILSQMNSIGDIDNIIEYLLRFLVFYEDLNYDKARTHYLSIQGYLSYILCDYQSALKSGEEAYEEAQKNNKLIPKAVAICNLAMLHVKLEEFDVAMAMVNEVEADCGQYGLKEWYFYSSLLTTKALCYINSGELDKALKSLEDIKTTESYQSSVLEQMEYDHHMGQYYYLIEDYERALEFYKRAIRVAENKNIFYDFKDMYSGIAKVLFKLEFIEESDIYKEKADEMTRDTIEKANNSIVQKANLAIEIEQKIKVAKAKEKYHKNRQVLNIQKFDELTELLNREYILNELNESFKSSEVDALPKLLVLDIENMNTIISATSPIYGDKFIYEVSKVIKSNVDEYIIGRLDINQFLIVYSLVDIITFEDEVKWLITNLNKTSVEMSDTLYNIEFSYKTIDVSKLMVEQQLEELDIYKLFEELNMD